MSPRNLPPTGKSVRKPAVRRRIVSKPLHARKTAPLLRHATPLVRKETRSTAFKGMPVAKAFFSAVGRRKEAIVGVRLSLTQPTSFKVNGRDLEKYFSYPFFETIARAPLQTAGLEGRVSVDAHAEGGGKHGQAVALRLAVSRALVAMDEHLRPTLRAHGYLTRDPRAKERKKYGLKRARRAPQWQKR
ncbi:MAG: 30S ribosomal protein S9 [Patescibacteria group bacterium]